MFSISRNLVTSISKKPIWKAVKGNLCKKFVTTTSVTEKEIDCKDKELVVVEQYGRIRTIGINRPEKRNCVNTPTAEALLKAFKEFDEDPNCTAAVLYGVGGNFCAGFDLEELSGMTDFSKIPTDRGPMGCSRLETRKPVIAAVEGYAVAGGFELALWCDVRIVDEMAVMGVYCRRFGVPLIDGGTVRLPAIVGLGRALDIIMTGRKVDAKEALAIGLANQVTACGAAIGRAVFYAEGLEQHPQEALLADRNSARRNAFHAGDLQEALLNEHNNGLRALLEGQEGATRFSKGAGRHGKSDKNADRDIPTSKL